MLIRLLDLVVLAVLAADGLSLMVDELKSTHEPSDRARCPPFIYMFPADISGVASSMALSPTWFEAPSHSMPARL